IYLSTIPTELNAFYEFCNNLDDQYLSDMETKFDKVKNLLDDAFQVMMDREKSKLFCKIWNIRQITYSPNSISTIADLAGIFKQADSDWNTLISKIKNNTLQYTDLELYANVKWELEMSFLFPNQNTIQQLLETKPKQIQNIITPTLFQMCATQIRNSHLWEFS
ncbi:hypothetical protein RFI_39397, partial [Reticulomyxa filosa]